MKRSSISSADADEDGVDESAIIYDPNGPFDEFGEDPSDSDDDSEVDDDEEIDRESLSKCLLTSR